MTRVFLTTIAVLTAANLAKAADEPKPAPKPDFGATYGVLSERNIFLRERQAPRPPRVSDPRPRVDPSSIPARERATVLRGITIEDNELHAYLENTRNNQVTQVSPGDALVGGHVAEIVFDAIAYTTEGRTTWVAIGDNLSGGRDAVSTAAPDAGPTTGPAEGAAPGGPTPPVSASVRPPGMSMEDWLKARHAQQSGRK